jgi:hypothetical protein
MIIFDDDLWEGTHGMQGAGSSTTQEPRMSRQGRRFRHRPGRGGLPKLRRGLLTGAALGVAALGLAPHAAWANDFGNPPGCCYFADNSIHTYYPWSLTSGTLSNLRYAMGTRLESTDMTTDEFQSQDANTDVVAVDVAYGTDEAHSWWGRWTCDSVVAEAPWRCN